MLRAVRQSCHNIGSVYGTRFNKFGPKITRITKLHIKSCKIQGNTKVTSSIRFLNNSAFLKPK